MEKIKGAFATAISFAKVIEPAAKEQICRMCNYDFTEGSKIRIMPDVHAGKGCTIGTTMTVTDKIVPNIVGVDIGCGMYTVDLGYQEIDFKKLDEAAHRIPSGANVWAKKQADFDLQQLYCDRHLKNLNRIECSIGTLGGGNHFIEVDKAHDGRQYLIIHTGSRNLGKQVAEFYQKKAVEVQQDKIRKKLIFETEHIVETLKELGQEKAISAVLSKIREKLNKKKVPDDLCYLSGIFLNIYLHDVALCQEFAKLNREQIAKILLEFTGLKAEESFHTVHNYIDIDEKILRKGAISAHKGEKVLIPINMRDGSILAIGKGNPDWNYSAPHGAGRIMSRSEAKKNLSLNDYKTVMDGIYTTSINENTLDESPMAYKSIDDILNVIDDTVEIIDVLKPIYNYKDSGSSTGHCMSNQYFLLKLKETLLMETYKVTWLDDCCEVHEQLIEADSEKEATNYIFMNNDCMDVFDVSIVR